MYPVIKEIMLYRSKTRGDYGEESDIELLFITDSALSREKRLEIYDAIEVGILHSKEEIRRAAEELNAVLVLHEKGFLFSPLKDISRMQDFSVKYRVRRLPFDTQSYCLIYFIRMKKRVDP